MCTALGGVEDFNPGQNSAFHQGNQTQLFTLLIIYSYAEFITGVADPVPFLPDPDPGDPKLSDPTGYGSYLDMPF